MSATSHLEQERTSFIRAATWHGDLAEADALLAKHPALATLDIHTAAILGDYAAVEAFLAGGNAMATSTSQPYGANALTHLGLSKYLRFGKRSDEDFVRTATALLDAGADANGGFWTTGKFPEFETPLYGAAGVAQNAALTRLLLDRGADPNDGEVVYHSPEGYDISAMKLVVETGRVTKENLSCMLIRKHDWHDIEGERYLLEHGADPNTPWHNGFLPLHHALSRDNALGMIALLLDHGADPYLTVNGLTGVARAAWQGRSDVLRLLRERGFSTELQGIHRLIAACAMGDTALAKSIVAEEAGLKPMLFSLTGHLLARFSSTNNATGIITLLDLGIDVNTPYLEGDGYYEIPPGSLAIHVAAWRGWPEVQKILLERGAKVNEPDANGRTPLMLAVRACTQSYWSGRCSLNAIRELIKAGASATGIRMPTGHAEIDALLG